MFKVVWSDSAENELDKIFEYYNEKAGNKVAKKIIKEIFQNQINLPQINLLHKLKISYLTEKINIDI